MDTFIILTGAIFVIALVVYVMYLLDTAGVFDSTSEKFVDFLDKTDIASKWE